MTMPHVNSAESRLKVESREELVYLLGQACEIEHGLMCEYLYAQFSLKRRLDEGLTPDQLGRVQAWETALFSVIKQEMLHSAASSGFAILNAARRTCFTGLGDRAQLAVRTGCAALRTVLRAFFRGFGARRRHRMPIVCHLSTRSRRLRRQIGLRGCRPAARPGARSDRFDGAGRFAATTTH